MAHHNAQRVEAPLVTRPFKLLGWILAAWGLLMVWRFAGGLGPVTGLSDGYPWGIWIAFEVVTGTALACGGYAVAILCYILNRGQYHPLVRPAILTSALGYSMAALAIIVDVGRPWWMWKIPISFGKWNLNSALLEVALCVMAYVFVLWIELSPAFMERWKDSPKPWLSSWSEKGLRLFDKILIFIVALGILLPTMHQSSLGTVMLLAGHKLHQLWATPLIPLLFLISCIGMGYAVVVFESAVSARMFSRPKENDMLASLSGAMVVVLWLFVAIRIVDLIVRGRLGLMFNSWYSLMFWLEIALAVVPAVLLMGKKARADFGTIFRAAALMILGGSLYRFDAYLVAYDPGTGWSYFPSVPEVLISLGMVALEVMLYLVIVKNFPILSGHSAAGSER